MDLSKYDWKFTIFDTPVRVMATFWVLCIFFSPFATNFEGPWLFGLAGWSAAVLATFLAHELGHAYAMRKAYGGRPRIELGIGRSTSGSLVFGGLTSSPTYGANTPENRAFTAGAGPLAEIAASLIFVILMSGLGFSFQATEIFGIPFPIPDIASFRWLGVLPLIYLVYFFVYGFVVAGLVWGIFNILPIYPCDGGQLLLAYLSKRKGEKGVKLTLQISIACSLGLALMFLLNRQIFMTIFMIFSAYQNYRLLLQRGFMRP